MNSIPWYRSTVFTVGLSAALIQLTAMLDAAFIEALASGKRGALAQLGGFLLTAIVVGVRAIASTQPITTTQAKADAANKQAGFARPLVLAFMLAAAAMAAPVLQGCAGLGLQQPKTFNESAAYAISQTTALRSAATSALVSQQISRTDAEYVLKLTDESRQLIDSAKALAQAGESVKGKTQLELATAILTQLQAYLNARQGK